MPNKVQMWKLILGIIAVVCVQFAFVNFITLRPYLDFAAGPVYVELASVEPDLAPTDELISSPAPAEKPAVPDHVASTIKAARARIDRSRFTATTASAAPAVVKPVALRSDGPSSERGFEPPQPAAPGDFEAVVIRYNRDSAISDCDRVEPSKPKRRSYIARSAPLVKKPWDWIKAAGSRLY